MRWDLLLFNVSVKLRSEAAQSYLGALWWLLEPLFLMLTFYVVFELLLQRGGPGYVQQLLVGITVWTWFANAVGQSSATVLRASNLLMQVPVNKLLFPLTTVLAASCKQLILFAMLLIYLALVHGISLSWWSTLVLIPVQFCLVSAVALMAALLVPFVPDLNFVISIGLRFLMFCSGVFYTAASIDEAYRSYFLMNPMANLIEQYRAVLLHGQGPDWISVLVILLAAMAGLVISFALARRFDQVYPRLALL